MVSLQHATTRTLVQPNITPDYYPLLTEFHYIKVCAVVKRLASRHQNLSGLALTTAVGETQHPQNQSSG
jgi:hypothetical protein